MKVGNQWRFRKAMIDTWLDDQMLGVTPRYVEPPRGGSPQRMLALANCFEPGHVIPEFQGRTKTSVIVELAGLAQRLLTTEAMVAEKPKDKEEASMPGGGHGMGM